MTEIGDIRVSRRIIEQYEGLGMGVIVGERYYGN